MNNEIRLQVIDELVDELRGYGHYNAVTHVMSCRKRLVARMGEDGIRHKTSTETPNDTAGQVEQETRSAAVSGF
jgi:hypothetical protein